MVVTVWWMRVQYLSHPEATLSLPPGYGRTEVDKCPAREEGALRNVPWLKGPRAPGGHPVHHRTVVQLGAQDTLRHT